MRIVSVKRSLFSPDSGVPIMEPEKCKVGLTPDKKYDYRITVEGNCTRLLKDVKENLGEYGRRYLEDRIITAQTEPEINSQEETL